MKKRLTALAMAFVMVLGTVAAAAGAEKTISVSPMSLSINGQAVTPLKSDGTPAEVFSYDGATYVPLRYLSELLGIQVEWDKNDPNTAKLVSDKLAVPTGGQDGVYTGTGSGFGGAITATVTVAGGKITACTLVGDSETPAIGGAALEKLQAQVVAAGSADIDGVSGATMTSGGVKAAVAAALNGQENSKPAQDETLSCDVVIAGGGVAGLSAAIEALDAGSKVILVEKMARVGGSTSMSEGRILAAGSYLQKQKGIEDTPAQFADYLMKISLNRADPEFINIVANSSAATVDWLVSQGVEFQDTLTTPVPDMQPMRGMVAKDAKGTVLIDALLAQVESKGGTVLLETPATELITNAAGEVTGLVASRADGSVLTVNAKSVILATGGYTGSPELMAKYAPSYPKPVGNAGPGNTGDGLLMAQAVGADILANDCLIAQLTDKGVTNRWDACGLFVSPAGERFINENLPRPRRARATISAIGSAYPYYIHDESEVNDKMAQAIANGTAYEASSVAELAGKIGASPAVLQATIDRYNKMCAAGTDEDFGKDAKALKAIDLSGKLYAIRLTYNCAGTTGGPRINTKAQVLNTSGQVIKGLYAAGEVASGAFFANEYPGSGAAIQCYTTFGRIAGRNAAAEK